MRATCPAHPIDFIAPVIEGGEYRYEAPGLLPLSSGYFLHLRWKYTQHSSQTPSIYN
jgi:hypothetical protein